MESTTTNQGTHEFITNIFERKRLDNADDDGKFGKLVDAVGIYGLVRLIEECKYPHGSEIIQLAMNYDFDRQATRVGKKIEFAFGCRHPDSKPYSVDQALIIAKPVESPSITSAFFQNGADFIGHPKNKEEAIKIYESLLEQGWIPMTNLDMERTAGITIDEDTIVSINPNDKTTYHDRRLWIGALFVVIIGTWLTIKYYK